MILGVDLGSFSVKTSEKVTFLSKISEIDNFTGDNKIIYNDKILFIGEGEFNTDWNKSKKQNTLPLLFTAIYRSTSDNINKVVIGLPINMYKKNKDDLKQLILNNRCAKVNGRELVISDIEVAPEGAAAYYNLSPEQIKKIGSNQLIIINIGGRTTDISVFEGNKIIDIQTIPVGMLNVYQNIIDYINTKYTQSFKLEESQDIIINGLLLDGEQKDITFITPILKNCFNSIYKELQLKFNINKGFILLTGGGSISLQQAFKNRLKNIIISNNCIFDDALGFKKIGESLWLKK